MFMIMSCLYVAKTKKMGNGVFTSSDIKANTIIEVSPVLVMNNKERILLDQTLLHDYIFEWGDKQKQCCMALGYISIYNHAYLSNCEYEMEFDKLLIRVTTVRAIKKGEELFINYNGTYNNSSPLWFNAV